MSVGALRDLEQGRTRSPRWGTVEELAAALSLDPAQRAELTRAWRSGDSVRAPRRPCPGERSPGRRINVLGPLAAWRDGVQVALESVRQRAVLGLMALQAVPACTGIRSSTCRGASGHRGRRGAGICVPAAPDTWRRHGAGGPG
jgi:hypothetical protein